MSSTSRSILEGREAGFSSADYGEEVARVAVTLEEGRYAGQEYGEPFVMAVCSQWGTGKTHFVRRVASRIESDYASAYLHPELPGVDGSWVMWFNPWSFRDPAQLVEVFLDQLGNHVTQLPVHDHVVTPAGDEIPTTREELCDAVRNLGNALNTLGGVASLANV